jgi:hypothetical protein
VPGDYTLSVYRNGARHQQAVTVLPGRNPEIEVRLPPSRDR